MPKPATPPSEAVTELPGAVRAASLEHFPDFELLAHLGQLFDVTQDLLCVVGFDQRTKYLNGAWEEVLGYSREELMSNPLVQYVHPDDREATLADMEKVRGGKPTRSFENRYRCQNGSYRWFSWSATASAPQRCFYVSGRDVTEKKRSEERILRLAQAIQNSTEMICMGDSTGQAVYANQSLLDSVGCRSDDVMGKPLAETLLSGSNPATLAGEIHQAIKRHGKWRGECLQRCDYGPAIPVSLSIGVIKDDDGRATGTYGISQDISERKRAERELAERTDFLNSLIEGCPVGIVAIDVDHRVKLCNPAFENTFNFREQDILGRPLYDLLTTPEIRHEVNTNALRFREGKTTHTVTKRARRDGTLVDVEAYSVPLGTPDDPAGAVVLYQDITERKRIEQQLQQAQKMEAVGQLAGGIAHDFNNLLMVILGYAGVLSEVPGSDDETRKKIGEISKAAHRAASLTRQLLTFSRKQILEPRILDVNSLIDEVKGMLARLISEDIALVTNLQPALGYIKADQGQIEQVIINLAVNARDAMPEGGTLTISTANLELTENSARMHETVPPGSYLKITVSDTGTGMDPATQSRAFEPFFTTKEQSRGTGLGLATVYGIVKQSDGFISLSSEPGQGTTFEILFPSVGDLPKPVPGKSDCAASLKGSETILLVEDDDVLRELILETLNGAGYRVIEAADGVEGLEIALREAGSIDLVLTDVIMPRMKGTEMAEKISGAYPEAKVLFMSGYSEFPGGRGEILRQGRTLLQKPFELQSLLHHVRESLCRPAKLGVVRS